MQPAMRTDDYRSSLSRMTEERKVEMAHYLIQSGGDDWMEPAQIEIIFDAMPHSHGRDLLILAHWEGRLKQGGTDPWLAFGMCDQFKFGDMERRAYKVLAYQAESTMRAARFHCTSEMHYRIAGLALAEMVLSEICANCNSAGCAECDFVGRIGWTQTKRIDRLETNIECWNRTLGKAYRFSLLPALATQEREAAKQFLRNAADRFGLRLEHLLLAAAHDPDRIRVRRKGPKRGDNAIRESHVQRSVPRE